MALAYMREFDFEDFANSLESVLRFGPTRLAEIRELLSKEESQDSYATSMAYYAYTGRRGLWFYRHTPRTYIPFCWHPNVDGQILIFPPCGPEKSYRAIEALMNDLPSPPAGFRLARFGSADQAAMQHEMVFSSQSFVRVKEKVLDWIYPSHILSTNKAASLVGHDYMLIRNRLRQVKKHETHFEPLTAAHSFAVTQLARRWAVLHADESDSLIDLTSPYSEMLNLVRTKELGLKGLVFFVDGEIQAATIWDVSNRETPTANIFMNLCNKTIKGLSELAIHTTAEHLAAQGVQYMNLGGSESEGLDHYKKKFHPVRSINLCSLEPKTSTLLRVPHRHVATGSLQIAV